MCSKEFISLFVTACILIVERQAVFQESKEWEHILRELIFKTLSPSPVRNINLYKQLLHAPFYRASINSSSSNDSIALISTGSVYFLNNNLIFCQDGCKNCNECLNQNNLAVRWTLKSIRKSQIRNDLQFTIVFQDNGMFDRSNGGQKSIVYLITQNKDINLIDKSIQKNKSTKLNESNLESNNATRIKATIDSDLPFHQNINSKELYDTKDNFSAFEFVDTSETESVSDTVSTDHKPMESQVILGSDYLGRKYLIQVIHEYTKENDKLKNSSLMAPPTVSSASRFYTTTSKAETSYQNIIQYIISSLNHNRKFIERFLSDDRTYGISFGKKRRFYVTLEDLEYSNLNDEIKDTVQERDLKPIKLERKGEDTANKIKRLDGLDGEENLKIERTEIMRTATNINKERIPRLNRIKNISDVNVNRLNKNKTKLQDNITFSYLQK